MDLEYDLGISKEERRDTTYCPWRPADGWWCDGGDCSAAGAASAAARPDEGQRQPVRHYLLDAGVVVVDTKLANYGPDILTKIRKVTDKPVTMVINTHTHGDHTGSNEAFPATIDFVAHENTKANMMKMDAFKGEKAAFLPKRTFKDKMSV